VAQLFSLGETSRAMSIFGRQFEKKQAVELDDPVFGHLTFDRGVWTSIPVPQANGFMITVAAPEGGPTAEQRDFYEHIRSRLPDFQKWARDYMQSRVDQSVDVSRLSVYSVEVGSAEEAGRREFVLELADEDGAVVHRVSFRADEPLDYGFDD
jgi:hypothetical protein